MGKSRNLSRRRLLSAASATAVLAFVQWPSHVAAASVDVDTFLKLSQNLTKAEGLSGDIAAAMLEGFEATGKDDAIAALAAGETDEDLANDVVAAWYTGYSPDPASTEVLAYQDALLWQAMNYTKPMTECGGEVGYWAGPPEA